MYRHTSCVGQADHFAGCQASSSGGGWRQSNWPRNCSHKIQGLLRNFPHTCGHTVDSGGGGGCKISTGPSGSGGFQVSCSGGWLCGWVSVSLFRHISCPILLHASLTENDACMVMRVCCTYHKGGGGVHSLLRIGMLDREGQPLNFSVLQDFPNASCSMGLHVHLHLARGASQIPSSKLTTVNLAWHKIPTPCILDLWIFHHVALGGGGGGDPSVRM